MKSPEIKNRLALAKEAIGKSFTEKTGVPAKNVSNVINNENIGVSASIMGGLFKAGVSLDWLMSGQGEMMVADQQAKIAELESKYQQEVARAAKIEKTETTLRQQLDFLHRQMIELDSKE